MTPAVQSQMRNSMRRAFTTRHSSRAKESTSGVAAMTPMVSPAHQISHPACRLSFNASARASIVTPTLADTSIPVAAASARSRISRRRSNAGRKPIRFKSHAVNKGPIVSPTAMPSAAGHGARVTRFTANAPSVTPGQQANPERRNAATAIPVGSQSSVMCVPKAGSMSPSQPVKKYKTASTRIRTAVCKERFFIRKDLGICNGTNLHVFYREAASLPSRISRRLPKRGRCAGAPPRRRRQG